MSAEATLLLSCPDRPGLVYHVTQFLLELGANIIHADQHLDREAGMFFQRIRIEAPSLPGDADAFAAQVSARCAALQMQHRFIPGWKRRKVAILASKQLHCVYDLLLRQRAEELDAEICCLLSNHEDAREVAHFFQVPFHHLPVTKENKPAQEAALIEQVSQYGADLVVLARYMQILSGSFLDRIGRPVINIHHSFLPAFIGERPYHKAYERGVKLIGATAHYVTAELDAGPIIEQDVVRTNHADQVEDMVRKGRDIERLVLARAVRLHLQDRVLVYGNKTVIFG